MLISILIRFRNEENYLEHVLNAVKNQEFDKGEFEIVAVDNFSTDHSLQIARKFTSNVHQIEEYLPGKALNNAINIARGKYIAVLSAHTIPSDRYWLQNLYSHMNIPNIAGVYGAQLYPVNCKFLDKRDLDIFSTTVGRIETQDSDFWNANSMFPKSVWEVQPFDEVVFELEDHYWTKCLLPHGYKVHFEPSALVYHYSHIERLDREHLPITELNPAEMIAEATTVLLNSSSAWSEVMRAGLILSSLTKHEEIVDSVAPIGKHLLEHWDFDVRWRMAQALGKIPSQQSAKFLVSALHDISYYPRDEAAWSLGRLGAVGADALMNRLNEFGGDTLPFVALALGLSRVAKAESKAISILEQEISAKNPTKRRNGVYFAGELVHITKANQLIPLIEFNLNDNSTTGLQAIACWALGEYAESAALQIDWDTIRDIATFNPDFITRYEATVAIGKLGYYRKENWVVAFLYQQLSDPASRVRFGAMQSLRRLSEIGVSLIGLSLDSYRDLDFGVMYELHKLREISHF